MQMFSEDKRDYSSLISLLGTYFQIRDDLANLKSTQVCCQSLPLSDCLCVKYEENKSFCEDLTEGKFSFPIIHGITTQAKDSTLMSKA